MSDLITQTHIPHICSTRMPNCCLIAKPANAHTDQGSEVSGQLCIGINPYAINFGCAMGLADLGQLHIGLSGCAMWLIDPGQLYIGLPCCAMRLTRYISGSVRLCNRASSSLPIIYRDISTLSSCATGQVNSGQLYIGISPVTYRGSWILLGCITGHSEYRVSQPDVQLCNWMSGCITGIQLHNQHSWPSVQNIYTICRRLFFKIL